MSGSTGERPENQTDIDVTNEAGNTQERTISQKAGGVAASAGKAVGRGFKGLVGRIFSLLFKTKPGWKFVLSFAFLNFFYNEFGWSLYQHATQKGLASLWTGGGGLNFTILSVAVVGLVFFAVMFIGAFRKMNLLSWIAVLSVLMVIYLPLFYFDLFAAIARPWLIELVYFSTAIGLVIKNNKTFIIRWLWGDVGVHQESIDGDENC